MKITLDDLYYKTDSILDKNFWESDERWTKIGEVRFIDGNLYRASILGYSILKRNHVLWVKLNIEMCKKLK